MGKKLRPPMTGCFVSNLVLENRRAVYVMLDNPRRCQESQKPVESTPAIPVKTREDWTSSVLKLNSGETYPSKFYGVFWTVNAFRDGVRKKDNLESILSWSVDIDIGTKESQREKIKQFLTPTLVVETKRGYQCYWDALDPSLELYDRIQLGLCDFFGGDKNARDISRILRMPYFYHCKDPSDRFLVTIAHSSTKKYTEKQMLELIPKPPTPKQQKELVRKELSFISDDDVFNRIYSLDCEQGLLRLSGHPAVGGEKFTFKRVTSGNLNLYVDGKGTSVFIDKHKKIGSSDKGGPTLLQWLKWYSGDYKTAMRVMREVFPEIFKKGSA